MRPEFAARRTTKRIDGVNLTGWFTEDFTWAELSTLRATERLPQMRHESASFDGTEPILRFTDLLALLDAGAERTGRAIGVVAEVKHPTYFASIGIPLDGRVAEELKQWDDGARIIVECFEQTALDEIRRHGVRGRFVYLLESRGSAQLTDAGLAGLAKNVDGVSLDKSLLLRSTGTDLVMRAHAAGLEVFTWTLRPENGFLAPERRIGARAADWGDWRAEFGEILGTGVDGIFVDHPDLGVAARDTGRVGVAGES
jgi:glycerophosphoryl diester phosphodiesterase